MKTALGVIIFFVLILLAATYFYTVSIQTAPPPPFISAGNVEGSAVLVDDVSYTLNFAQQNQLINILNQANPARRKESEPVKNGKAILIYLFDQQNPLTLTPVDDYELLQIDDEHFLAIESSEELKEFLIESVKK